MTSARNTHLRLLVGVLFLSIAGAIVFFLTRFGSAYRTTVGSIETQTSTSEPVTLAKAKNIRRVRIKQQDQDSCLEVASDGVIRQYSTCGDTLTRADRLMETKNVVKLLRLISERKWAAYKGTTGGRVIEVEIETEDGRTETGYLVVGDDEDKEIIGVVDDIVEDIPTPTAIPTATPTPVLPPGVTPSPTPTPLPPGVPTPTPTPDGEPVVDHPFLCGYDKNGRPINVSNTMCSTGPTPMP